MTYWNFRHKFNLDFDTIFSSPLSLWIIAIISAVMMWVHVTSTDEENFLTRKFSCPIEYRSLDPQAILRGRTSEVDLEIKGPEKLMLNLNYDQIKVYVDARNLIPGKKYSQNISVELPDNLKFVSCTPSQVTLDLVRQVTRLMQVEIVLPQNIPEGQYIEDVEIIPKEVGIKGAEDDVAKVGALRITPSFEELQSGRELLMAVKFSQSEPFEGSVNIEPAQVRFKANIARGLPRKKIPVNVKLTGELNGDFEIRSIVTEPSEIQIEGNTEDLAKIEAVETENIDVSNFVSDQIIVAPLKSFDVAGISVLNNKSIRLNIKLGEVRAEKNFSNIPVELKNISDASKNWSVTPPSVNLVVEGRPSLIEKFTVENSGLKVYVDMSNIFITPVVLPVRSEIISEDAFKITRIEPSNITVNMNE